MTREPFIETFTGERFQPLAADISTLNIIDIAHALSNQCRFSGHTKVHYSVAEHSVRVARLLASWSANRETQRWGLLHDASEAYLVDLPTPLKASPVIGPAYRAAEAALMAAICTRFHLTLEQPDVVHEADATLLATEVRDLMWGRAEHWAGQLTAAPLPERITPWSPREAELEFLRVFKSLT